MTRRFPDPHAPVQPEPASAAASDGHRLPPRPLANAGAPLPDPVPDCLSCGACCASFRVDFAAEELLSAGGRVPDGLAVTVTSHTCRLRGTDHSPPRCAALTGRVGERAPCGIYEWRPSPCREFEAGSDACWRARRRHGLGAPKDF